MNHFAQQLQIDPAAVCREIEDLIRSTMKDLHRQGAVVGLSGGLDAAVAATLTVRGLGAANVHLLNLPERDSKPIHRKHAKRLAEHLGIRLKVKSITPILRAAGNYKLLPLRFVPTRKARARLVQFGKSKFLSNQGENLLADRLHTEANTWVAKGNAYAIAKHRARMIVVYQYAEVRNLMVVGAANRTEWLTGTFSKWGVDHCADIMPLLHLYRSQLENLAEYLQVPDYIQNKPADPDVIPGINNKEELLGNFETVDQILYGIENHIDRGELYRAYGEENVERLRTLWAYSAHMREVVTVGSGQ